MLRLIIKYDWRLLLRIRVTRVVFLEDGVPKDRICVTIDRDLLDWVDQKIEEKHFANRSHAVEYSLKKVKDERVK